MVLLLASQIGFRLTASLPAGLFVARLHRHASPRSLSVSLDLIHNIRMENEQDDTKLTDELMKHLENQNESMVESYKLMFNQLQKLQVEEEMLMRKLHEVMSAHGQTKKNKDNPKDSGNSEAKR